ncbi:Asp-tRNA(Asn)/Glu-tRNA(Gln) amidotransferase subunit GatA [Desulfatirhabdium butyrativorans]|uniref:Asp-tRNA(Asn)/Glu-tRNA(Gln) amidotransferase subunit GatA n=1 Tax=Desulfatirhabdium butyrativorans TaxID=340467 RepID=UPI000407F308|nr:Asp-tRNA(Asn)/Glu-tRNA(Gln) amidotransferase subunit GatA [Desulfatirhabdium butyrativorans]
MNLAKLTIRQAHEGLKRKEFTAVELTQAMLSRIELVDPAIRAYLTVVPELAMAQAKEADRAIQQGRMGPLTGIPLAIKDLICTRGIRTTCASKILENFVPPYDATVIEKLSAAGAIILGKLNMDEFAMGSSTEHSAFQVTRNPWDTSCIPGGSSGGSAASVAADICLGSLGSDTGGSIRQPASHCGVVGLKPTYGRVSRYGLVAFASSLDQIGPLGKSVWDVAAMLSVIAGHDPKDSTSAAEPVPDYLGTVNREIRGMRIGIVREYAASEGMDPDVAGAIDGAIATLKSLGAEIVDVSLPHTAYAVQSYYVIAPAEACSNLARYDGVKYGFRADGAGSLMEMYRSTRSRGFGQEVQRRILLGTFALSSGYYDAYYRKASQVRTLIRNDFIETFRKCDVIAGPVAPTPAFRIGAHIDDPLTMYLNDIFTISANLAGIPGLSVPCGFSGNGLPIGLQIMGPHFSEATLLQVANQFETATEFHMKKPRIPGSEG